MNKYEIETMLSVIDKHTTKYTNAKKYYDYKTAIDALANCVLGLSAVVRGLIKGE